MDIFLIAIIIWFILGAVGSVFWWIDHYGKLSIGDLLFAGFYGSATGLIIWILYFCFKYDIMNIVIYRKKQ